MVADRIKALREQKKMTQAELAKRLGITRSGVNAWEMGISVPSTQYIVELANIFGVSADYLLGRKEGAALSVSGLTFANHSFTMRFSLVLYIYIIKQTGAVYHTAPVILLYVLIFRPCSFPEDAR